MWEPPPLQLFFRSHISLALTPFLPRIYWFCALPGLDIQTHIRSGLENEEESAKHPPDLPAVPGISENMKSLPEHSVFVTPGRGGDTAEGCLPQPGGVLQPCPAWERDQGIPQVIS